MKREHLQMIRSVAVAGVVGLPVCGGMASAAQADSTALFTTTVQHSTDLETWVDAPAGAITSSPAAEPGFDDITTTIAIPAAATRFFARLKGMKTDQ